MDDESVDGLVTLTERTVNLVNQLNMPLVEVSLVLKKHINQLMATLQQHLDATGQTVGERVHSPGHSMPMHRRPTHRLHWRR